MFTDRTFWAYPWDIADGEPCQRLEDIRQLGATAISIPYSHHSLRALAPHHSGRKVFHATSAICFRPAAGEFAPSVIQPHCSTWATADGPVAGLFEMAANVDLRIRAWTVVFHNTPLASEHPDSAITNCFGDTFPHALCPSAPKSRQYALQLVQAIAARPIHAIELEALGFYGYEHLSHHDKCGIVFDMFHHFLFSCCFCTNCRIALRSSGLEPDFIVERFCDRLCRFFCGRAPAVNRQVEAEAELCDLIGEGVARELLEMRKQCVLKLLSQIRDLLPQSIELTVTSGLSSFECSAQFGADPNDTLRIADRLLLVVFEPDEAIFRKRFDDALQCCPDPSRWIAGIRIFPPDTKSEEAIQPRLDFLENHGFRAVHLYHYGLAPRHFLAAAAHALRSVEVATR